VTDGLLTAREVANVIGVKAGTVLDWYEAGKIPGYKFSRCVRFSLDEVLATGRPDGGGETPSNSTPPSRGVVSVLPSNSR
jgi:excisionase family DNA binding protein